MTTLFQALPRHNNPLLTLLGVMPYRIVPADTRFQPSAPFVTVSDVDSFLQNGVKTGLFTGDEVGALHTQAIEAGLPTDTRALIARALDQRVEAELGELTFHVCSEEICSMLPGLPHGQYYRGEVEISDAVDTVAEAFNQLLELVTDEITPEQAILLLRQASSAGLPIDHEHLRDIEVQIPEEIMQAFRQRQEKFERQAIEDLGVRFSSFDLGGVGGMLIEINFGPTLSESRKDTPAPKAPPTFWERIFGRRGR